VDPKELKGMKGFKEMRGFKGFLKQCLRNESFEE